MRDEFSNIKLTKEELIKIRDKYISNPTIKSFFDDVYINELGYEGISKKYRIPESYFKSQLKLVDDIINVTLAEKRKRLRAENRTISRSLQMPKSIYDVFPNCKKWEIDVALKYLRINYPKLRELIDLKYRLNANKKSYTYEEIAQLKGMTASYAMNLLQKAREELRIIIESNKKAYSHPTTALLSLLKIKVLNREYEYIEELQKKIEELYNGDNKQILYMYFGMNNKRVFYTKEQIYTIFPLRDEKEIDLLIDNFAALVLSIFLEGYQLQDEQDINKLK